MMAAIHASETRETLCMAVLTALALICTAGLVATSQLSPDSTPAATNIVKGLLFAIFLILLASRRSKASLRAKAYREALEAADGSQSAFVLKRKAGKSPKLVALQFILGAALAFSLITLLAIIEPSSRLPWVML